jgi:hypothetical protein
MHPIVHFSFSVLLLFAAHASSYPRSTRGLAGAVFACPLSNWEGACVWRPLDFKAGQSCLSEKYETLPAGFTFGSIGPDEYGECELYSSTDCDSSGSGRTNISVLAWPGSADVGDTVRSMWCWSCKEQDCHDIKAPWTVTIDRPKASHQQL